MLAPVLALSLAACGGDSEGASVDGIELVSDGQLTTCTHLPYEPFQFREGEEIVGFDVDLVDLVAEDLGVEQAIVDTPFDTIQSGADLDTGKCDVAAAGMTINDVREENIDFADPYFDASQALLVAADSDIEGEADLAGLRVAVQTGTTGQEWARENLPDSELVTFEDLALLTAYVQNGEVDAGINDNGVLYDFAGDNPDVAVVAEFDTGEQYGVAVRTGNDALRERINEVLAAAREDGRYDEIYEKWFGTAPAGDDAAEGEDAEDTEADDTEADAEEGAADEESESSESAEDSEN
ncbi:polar amino acid transport system substrate-binding protein [Actinoalloteichus hymeniacidonis]|uniref:Amino acid ABC transporter n=1 Tax=Actinoalloteichus hymeniacidonis TaxID=340345 RepID=A0AAC9HVH4_9PSEU|nr:putative amino acid ABC transporter [Actinoalloteichus hymeniacidonis]MBB5905782.1 polar amino acid transport system substrate-binding protein [Actinoalloteichus hymeniacidonis]